jgi:hypothetical protein
MADPPPGGPEPPPTNTQETTASFTDDDLEPSTSVETRRRARKRDAFAPSDPAGRITTKEVWKLIGTLKDVIRHQTAAITATQNELNEIKHNQNVLQEQNEKLHEEVRALKAQIENTPAVTTPKTWAAVAANNGETTALTWNHQQPEKDQNCVRISTQRTFVDPRDNRNNGGNEFGRYLPIDAANNHIRAALKSDNAT